MDKGQEDCDLCKKWHEEVSPMTAPFTALQAVSRTQHREGESKPRPVTLLSWENRIRIRSSQSSENLLDRYQRRRGNTEGELQRMAKVIVESLAECSSAQVKAKSLGLRKNQRRVPEDHTWLGIDFMFLPTREERSNNTWESPQRGITTQCCGKLALS